MSGPFSHRQRPTPRGPRQWRRACEHGSSPVGAPAWVSKSTQQVLPGTGRDAPAPPGRSGPHRLPHSLPAAPLQALPFWYPGGRGLGSRGWGRLLARGCPGGQAGGRPHRWQGRRGLAEGQVSPPPDQGQPTPAAAPRPAGDHGASASLGVRPQPCPATSPKAAATGDPRPSRREQKLLHTHLWLDPGALHRAGGAAGPPSQQGPSLPPAGVASGQPTGAQGLNHKEAGPKLGAWTVGFSPALGAGTVRECPGNSDRPFPTAPDCPPVPAGGPDAWTFVSGRRPAAHPGKTPGGA